MVRRDRDAALEHIAREAAEWFARLQDPNVSFAERTEFSDWLRSSPHHVQEYLAVTRTWGDLTPAAEGAFAREALIQAAHDHVEPTNVVDLPARTQRVPVDRARADRVRWPRVAAAATVVGACLLGLFLATHRAGEGHYATASGETKVIPLVDGSVVHLNGESTMEVSLASTERRIRLVQGEGRFDVAKDARRPFFVETTRATVRAVGTVFNVRTSAVETAVTVLEGRVEVVSREDGAGRAGASTEAARPRQTPNEPRRLQLAAGQHAAVTSVGELVAGAGPSMDEARAWSERRLVFREERLADAIAEFNRYNARPMQLDDPALAAVHISGTFDATDPASLMEYLQRYEGLEPDGAPDGPIRLTRRRDSTAAVR